MRLWSFIFILFLNKTEAIQSEKWHLPVDHLLNVALQELFFDTSMFESLEALENLGFVNASQPELFRPWSIFVLSHPKLEGYLIKKYSNAMPLDWQLENYLRRLVGAEAISNQILNKQLKHIIVPKKWLYQLPDSFINRETGHLNYLLIVEKLDICPGGWWGVNYDKYQEMTFDMLEELCQVLHAIGGCDAWPQNQPFTNCDKIAFIDTEHVGRTPGDFLRSTLQFVNPQLQGEGEGLWEKLESALGYRSTDELDESTFTTERGIASAVCE